VRSFGLLWVAAGRRIFRQNLKKPSPSGSIFTLEIDMGVSIIDVGAKVMVNLEGA
jgi:hypothetical protein